MTPMPGTTVTYPRAQLDDPGVAPVEPSASADPDQRDRPPADLLELARRWLDTYAELLVRTQGPEGRAASLLRWSPGGLVFGVFDDPDRPVPWVLLPTDAAVRALWSVLGLSDRPAPGSTTTGRSGGRPRTGGARELRVDLALPGLDEPIAAAWAVDTSGLTEVRGDGDGQVERVPTRPLEVLRTLSAWDAAIGHGDDATGGGLPLHDRTATWPVEVDGSLVTVATPVGWRPLDPAPDHDAHLLTLREPFPGAASGLTVTHESSRPPAHAVRTALLDGLSAAHAVDERELAAGVEVAVLHHGEVGDLLLLQRQLDVGASGRVVLSLTCPITRAAEYLPRFVDLLDRTAIAPR